MLSSDSIDGPLVQVSTARPDDFLGFLAELREVTGIGRPVQWSCEAGSDVLTPLYHLTPPRFLEPDDNLADWQRYHRPGLFFYRQGPGFIVVQDQRPGHAARTLLDDPEQLALFARLSSPGVVPPGSAAAALRDAGVLFELGGNAVTLPHRLTRLPLPTQVL